MADAKIVVIIAILALFQISCAAAARQHGKPGASDAVDLDLPGGMRHKQHGKPSPSSQRSSGGGTPAVMTVNGFKRGEDGGDPSACDGHFHSDGDLIVALSSRWFAHGHRCHKKIRITSKGNGRTVEAQVVDECDSSHGCHNNIVDSSPAVWKALGLDTDVGEVPVTWSDA
ncbi:putative ripening-related protein 7 [Dichanthelium oligosanthes]|uniref:Putative ripening-related protein 7 n=1 Tax=Dichanthelium oligosanthes TaxID=888268 RepID=A0A1E5WII2_9POAL|nr:putative ripening-related protein 7 [Dichanthelium oligosanthes]